jgi:hypothetical protein
MPWRKIEDSKLTAVADAIRVKRKKNDTMSVSDMPSEILAIKTGDGGDYDMQVVPNTEGETLIVSYADGLNLYDGEYEITPTAEAQSLPTKNKHLEQDLIISAIPYYETSNAHGGTTINIA